jgi:hypothetical protein
MAAFGIAVASLLVVLATFRNVRDVRGHFPAVQRMIAVGQLVWLIAGTWIIIDVVSSYLTPTRVLVGAVTWLTVLLALEGARRMLRDTRTEDRGAMIEGERRRGHHVP